MSEDLDDIINKYVEGRLPKEAQVAFEAQLAHDADLKKQVLRYRQLALVIKEAKLLEIKDRLGKVHVQQQRQIMIKRGLITIASISILLIACLLWYRHTSTNKTSVLPRELKGSSATDSIKPTQAEERTKSSTPKETTLIKKSPLSKPGIALIDTVVPHEEAKQKIAPPLPKGMSEATKNAVGPTKETMKEVARCEGILLKADFLITPTCTSAQEGSIVLHQATGGEPPYTTQLHDAEKQPLPQAVQLPLGTYYVLISDAQGCTAWQKVEVPAKACKQHYTLSHTLNETWEVPSQGKKGLLKIVDKKGNVYFSRNLDTSDTLYWDGKSNNGEIKVGYYLFYIQHEDYSVTSGSITITE
ncbi:MAG TPA: hypothetical protein VL947_07515 [Cytophagales bacterium]|nr:hypothetical protein [Cytophagales bacterium]